MLKAEIKKLSVISDGVEKSLLKDIDFRIEDNKINVILGKNGTGKSTLIKSLARLLDERFYKINGKILFNNNDVLSLNYEELLTLRKIKMRYVFQDAVNSFDPLKNTGYYFQAYKDDAGLDLLLDYFLLPEKKGLFRLYPYEISGGMAQRLLLVHALLAKPELLILDEPTSGIDTPISNLILLKLKDFVKERSNSVLLVTQDIQFARIAGDRIAYLVEGNLSPFYSIEEFFGSTSEELKNFISAYRELV